MRRPSRRRLLATLVALTLLVMAVDLAGGAGPGVLRSAGGVAVGPLQRLLSPGDDRAGGDRIERAAALHLDTSDAVAARELRRLLAAPQARGRAFVPARVVAVGRQGAAGPERVTVDVGSRDGIVPDLCVVTADGLVGRVVSVAPWTADVLLLGSADLAVGVRVGSPGVLGTVGSGAKGAHRRPAGQLNLTAVERGRLRPGDPVETLGSVGGAPFPAGIPVGVVTSTDQSAGDLTPSAAVRPAVDVTTLDLVGVLLTTPRTTPRPSVTGGG
jgi:rod shape-determining protein MreC